jgi:5-methylcytosine-specific restriction endonuclease McrA
LRRFYSLITELVRGAWLQYIRRNNITELGATADLAEFLFGSERANLCDVRPVLEDIQRRRCFYCDGDLRGGPADVDHFIAWARYPVDLGHNFVLAYSKCNSAKGSMLASEDHLVRWLDRNRVLGGVLAAGFDSRGIMHDLAASTQIAHWTYAQAFQAGGVTWQRAKTFVHMRPEWEGCSVLREGLRPR